MKKLDLAMAIIDGVIDFHPSLIKEDPDFKGQDVFDRYRTFCGFNGHDVSSSELAAFDSKE